MFIINFIPLTLLGFATAKTGPVELEDAFLGGHDWWKEPESNYPELPPWNAIDGDKNTFAHDAKYRAGTSPLFVRLINSCEVTEVIVYPRRDCCFDRYTGMKVEIEKPTDYYTEETYDEINDEDDYEECQPAYVFDSKFVQNNMDVGLKFFCFPKVTAGRVKVSTPKGTHNHIAEVEAFCN